MALVLCASISPPLLLGACTHRLRWLIALPLRASIDGYDLFSTLSRSSCSRCPPQLSIEFTLLFTRHEASSKDTAPTTLFYLMISSSCIKPCPLQPSWPRFKMVTISAMPQTHELVHELHLPHTFKSSSSTLCCLVPNSHTWKAHRFFHFFPRCLAILNLCCHLTHPRFVSGIPCPCSKDEASKRRRCRRCTLDAQIIFVGDEHPTCIDWLSVQHTNMDKLVWY